jgi:glucose/arabinose dehydrogenase
LFVALILSSDSARATDQAESSSRNVLIGKPAMGDWTTDAPGVRHKITIADLAPPFATESANNGPHVVEGPADAQLHVPSGFKVQEYANGFRNPRFLLTAPNATGKALGEYEDFVTGFVMPQGNGWGRPVGITVSKDGSLLFSEDGNDTIWRVSYGK